MSSTVSTASSNPATQAAGPTPARHGHRTSLSLPQFPDLACPACRLDTGGGHLMLMLRDKTEQRDGRPGHSRRPGLAGET